VIVKNSEQLLIYIFKLFNFTPFHASRKLAVVFKKYAAWQRRVLAFDEILPGRRRSSLEGWVQNLSF
jgi:hypothetical protein